MKDFAIVHTDSIQTLKDDIIPSRYPTPPSIPPQTNHSIYHTHPPHTHPQQTYAVRPNPVLTGAKADTEATVAKRQAIFIVM